MRAIHPKIVTDEKMHPIAVQIDYTDWLEIQKILNQTAQERKLEKYIGSIELTEDPLAYQQRVRSEWQ